jgi:IS5 family transposase
LRRIYEIVVQGEKVMLAEAVASQREDGDGSGGDDSGGCDQLMAGSLIKPVGWPEGGNWGALSIDASCTPADITYPTDLKLLHEARRGEAIDRASG